jgi:hypothetical protein
MIGGATNVDISRACDLDERLDERLDNDINLLYDVMIEDCIKSNVYTYTFKSALSSP